MITRILLAIVALVVGVSAWAWSAEPPTGATVVHLNATAHQSVTPDTLHANLRIEYQAKTAREVQVFINRKMQEAVARVEKSKDIKPVTGYYNVHQRWEYPDPRNPKYRKQVWAGSQTLMLESKNHEPVLQLAGDLQDMGFVMNGLSYSLSRSVADTFREALVAEALGSIQRRAQHIAKQLGKGKVHIATIDLNGGQQPQPITLMRGMKAEMAMAEAMPAPVARPDETDISITVNAEVWLQD
jgi:uncharacterized protein YggE